MKKILSFVFAAMFAAASVEAATISYGWEDGGTILGSFGNLTNEANVSSGTEVIANVAGANVTPNNGSGMLYVEESPHGGTPQAYVAYIENLSEGDVIDASFFGWDSTEGASPSLRIWGHWANNGDVTSFAGSAGGNSTFTTTTVGGEWNEVSHTWTADVGDEALVIEVRLYSSPSTDATATTSFFIDDLTVDVTSSTATITVPSGAPIPEPSTVALLMLGAVAASAASMRSRLG